MSLFPIGIHANVTEYGENQLQAIEKCVVISPQEAPTNLLSDGDILILVKASEIVWTDTIMATGQYQHQAKLPYSPGMTYSGIVISVTPKASKAGIHLHLGPRLINSLRNSNWTKSCNCRRNWATKFR
jgi:NADPH2:quinone reductase